MRLTPVEVEAIAHGWWATSRPRGDVDWGEASREVYIKAVSDLLSTPEFDEVMAKYLDPVTGKEAMAIAHEMWDVAQASLDPNDSGEADQPLPDMPQPPQG